MRWLGIVGTDPWICVQYCHILSRLSNVLAQICARLEWAGTSSHREFRGPLGVGRWWPFLFAVGVSVGGVNDALRARLARDGVFLTRLEGLWHSLEAYSICSGGGTWAGILFLGFCSTSMGCGVGLDWRGVSASVTHAISASDSCPPRQNTCPFVHWKVVTTPLCLSNVFFHELFHTMRIDGRRWNMLNMCAMLIVMVDEVLPGFIAVGPARSSSKPAAVCSTARGRVAPVRAPSILTLPFGELCELIGERDARSAWYVGCQNLFLRFLLCYAICRNSNVQHTGISIALVVMRLTTPTRMLLSKAEQVGCICDFCRYYAEQGQYVVCGICRM